MSGGLIFPIFYGSQVSLRIASGWLSGSTISQHQASVFRILNSSAEVPRDSDGSPRMVSYGDTVLVELLPEGKLIGKPAGGGSASVHIGPSSEVLPLQFSLQPGQGGNASGQPLAAFVAADYVDVSHYTINSVIFQTATEGTLVMIKGLLQLSLNFATEFQFFLAQRPRVPTNISLPLALPPAYSNPHIPVFPPWKPFEPPFRALTPIRPIIPINPTSLNISSQPAGIVCLGKKSFCMPDWLAITVLIFTAVTICFIIAAKWVQ